MCLAIIAYRHLPEWPLFVAANRDERFDRPATPPHVESHGDTRILAPRDQRAGGTWIGVNERRLFAVVTNRTDVGEEAPPGSRSRGLLVRDVLAAPDPGAARRIVEEQASGPSAPFNLIIGHPDGLLLAERDHDSLRFEELPAGVHVVSNAGPIDDLGVPEVRRAGRQWQRGQGHDPWHDARVLLSDDQERDGLPPLCRRLPEHGTVSSTLLGVALDGTIRFEHANGPPVSTPYREIPFPEEVLS